MSFRIPPSFVPSLVFSFFLPQWEAPDGAQLPSTLLTWQCYAEMSGDLYVVTRNPDRQEGAPKLCLFSSSIRDLVSWSKCRLPESARHCEALFTYNGQLYALLEFPEYEDKVQIWCMHRRREVDCMSWKFVTDIPGTTHNYAVLVNGCQLVLAGGVDAEPQSLTKVLVWDLCERRWKAWPSLPRAIASGRLIRYVGRVILYGGWISHDGISVRPSVSAYSINPRCPAPWDEHHTSPLPLCLSGITTLGNNIVVTGGCRLGSPSPMSSATASPEYSDDEFDSALSQIPAFDTAGMSSGESACSLESDLLLNQSLPTSLPPVDLTRPDPVEDVPQRTCYFWDEISERWFPLPKLRHACSQPCLLYSRGRLICFGGKNEEGVRTRDIQVLVLHKGILGIPC